MKTQMRLKDIKNCRRVIIGAPYCGAQFSLMGKEPDGYYCNKYGWRCDVYFINSALAIVTGYDYSRFATDSLSSAQLKDLKALEDFLMSEFFNGN